MLDLINNAKSEICISQQSIIFMHGPIGGGYSQNIIHALNLALKRGVKINIIISPDHTNNENPNGKDYTGCSLDLLKDQLINNVPVDLQQNLNIKNSQILINNEYKKVANHAKVLISDNIVYVGSHNLYDNSHAECSIVFESDELVDKFKYFYWSPEWWTANSL